MTRLRWTTPFAFVSAILIFFIVGTMSYRAVVLSAESSRFVQHTDNVLEAIENFLFATRGSDAGFHGFVTTGDESFLHSYRAYISLAQKNLAEISALTTENPQQRSQISIVKGLLNAKIERERVAIDRLQNQGSVAVIDAGRKQNDQGLVGEFQAAVDHVSDEERRLWASGEAETRRRLHQTQIVIVFGTVLGLFVTCAAGWSSLHHNTARRLAEDALATGEAQFRVMANNISQLAWMADQSGSIFWYNQRWFDYTGTTLEEMAGWGWQKVHHPDHVQRVVDRISDCFVSGDVWEDEFPLRGRDGGYRWFLSRAVPIRNAEGTLVRWFGTNTDINDLRDSKIYLEQRSADLRIEVAERRRAEEQMRLARDAAEVANRAKSEFLANMSHEIRTPLNGILGMTDLTLETELTPEQRDNLETVKISADSLLNVINDILDFSKIEAGKVDLEEIDFDLFECIEGALRSLALRADEKGLELLCEVSPEVLDTATGDPGRLRQILVNLVGNALKFTVQGEVGLTVRVDRMDEDDATLHFIVSDTGVGIAPEKLQTIFDSFSQADTSTTREFGGTGLGLSISKRLIEMMGGRIWVESTPGKGSRFHFTVRLGTARDRKVVVAQGGDVTSLAGVKVLIVDDNRTNRRILEGLVKHWGMIPTVASNGEQALIALFDAHYANEEYRLILLDKHMPGMDGFSLVQEIHQRQKPFTSIIMMLTSGGQRGDTERCRELGISAYLLKPVRQSELRQSIARVLAPNEQSEPAPAMSEYSFQSESSATTGLRILVAEDNLVNRRVAIRLLEKRGHHVDIAVNGRHALSALEKDRFDLVLMDVQMPEMSGFEATQQLRALEQGTGLHQTIIAMTAMAMKGDRERCTAAGMDGYLSKPIRPQELDKVLESYLHKQQGEHCV